MILVTGGAGYIGSHTVKALRARGEEVLVADDLSEGHEAALLGAPLAKGDLKDMEYTRSLFESGKVEGVIHFAASCYVGVSMTRPGFYYRQNVQALLNLLEAMRDAGTKTIVFSSSCATYGIPDKIPITEDCPQDPINVYGTTKLVGEWMLRDFGRAHGIRSISLRYFNAAGADPDGELGEDHDPETHLIPLVLQVALGKREKISIFGDDYPTPDGTCIRDYIHIVDLAQAHLLALDAMREGKETALAYNLGNGEGYSVAQVVETARKVTGHPIPAEVAPRRPGDPPRLVGSSARIEKELGYKSRFPRLEEILETAWRWHKAHPDGYGEKKTKREA